MLKSPTDKLNAMYNNRFFCYYFHYKQCNLAINIITTTSNILFYVPSEVFLSINERTEEMRFDIFILTSLSLDDCASILDTAQCKLSIINRSGLTSPGCAKIDRKSPFNLTKLEISGRFDCGGLTSSMCTVFHCSPIFNINSLLNVELPMWWKSNLNPINSKLHTI